jgi:putative transposase
MTCHGIFPPLSIRVRPNLRTDNEANEIHRRTDHRDFDQHEAGAKCAGFCRKHDMSEGTFYAWKAKFAGMTVSDAKRLKALEDENAKLKRLLAEQMLDAAAMKELLAKNGRARREVRSCRAPSGQAWPVGAAGLPPCWGRSQDDPLQIDGQIFHKSGSSVFSLHLVL